MAWELSKFLKKYADGFFIVYYAHYIVTVDTYIAIVYMYIIMSVLQYSVYSN